MHVIATLFTVALLIAIRMPHACTGAHVEPAKLYAPWHLFFSAALHGLPLMWMPDGFRAAFKDQPLIVAVARMLVCTTVPRSMARVVRRIPMGVLA